MHAPSFRWSCGITSPNLIFGRYGGLPRPLYYALIPLPSLDPDDMDYLSRTAASTMAYGTTGQTCLVNARCGPWRGTDSIRANACVIVTVCLKPMSIILKGRYSFGSGRQNLSWGETDVFRLIDQINPLDASFGGFLVALDERRIPLDMLRMVYGLGSRGPFRGD